LWVSCVCVCVCGKMAEVCAWCFKGLKWLLFPVAEQHNMKHMSDLQNLDQWTLRMSWLDLQLMFTQFSPGSSELNQWLDTVAKAAIDVFQLTSGGVSCSLDGKEEKRSGLRPSKPGSIWLVAPLVSKLPSAVQGRVLKVAGKQYNMVHI